MRWKATKDIAFDRYFSFSGSTELNLEVDLVLDENDADYAEDGDEEAGAAEETGADADYAEEGDEEAGAAEETGAGSTSSTGLNRSEVHKGHEGPPPEGEDTSRSLLEKISRHHKPAHPKSRHGPAGSHFTPQGHWAREHPLLPQSHPLGY